MPPLEWPKYENLAGLLAEGVSELEATRLSGFTGQTALEGIKAGPRWQAVQARALEIRRERNLPVIPVAAPLDPDLDPADLTVSRLVREAWQTYVKATEGGQHKPALSALDLIGKLKGVYIQRQEITHRSFTQQSPEQLEKWLGELGYTEEQMQKLLDLEDIEYVEVADPPEGFKPR